MTPEERLAGLGLQLPEPARPAGSYVPAVRTGNLVFVSGQVPVRDGRPAFTGKVGDQVSLEQAQAAANLACLNGLSALKAELGELASVSRVVRVGVFVASAPGFTGQAGVANGASSLLEEVFGPRGRHARVSVGVAELPLGVPVEVELLVEAG